MGNNLDFESPPKELKTDILDLEKFLRDNSQESSQERELPSQRPFSVKPSG